METTYAWVCHVKLTNLHEWLVWSNDTCKLYTPLLHNRALMMYRRRIGYVFSVLKTELYWGIKWYWVIVKQSGEQNTFGFSSPLQQTIFHPITVAVCENQPTKLCQTICWLTSPKMPQKSIGKAMQTHYWNI